MDKTAQIFLLRLASFVREMPKNGEDNGQNCRRSRLSKILPLLSPASPFVFSIRLHKCVITIKKFATSLSPHSGPNMTHLSAGLRFVGTHLSIETSLSVPPWPAHHWCMVSPRKETVDFTRPSPLTASTGGTKRVLGSRRRRRGAFSGRCPLHHSPPLLPAAGAACASF